MERLGSPSVAWEDIEADLLEAGFIRMYAFEMLMTKEFHGNAEESLLRYFQNHVQAPVTLEHIQHTLKELFGEGKANDFNMIATFKKHINSLNHC